MARMLWSTTGLVFLGGRQVVDQKDGIVLEWSGFPEFNLSGMLAWTTNTSKLIFKKHNGDSSASGS